MGLETKFKSYNGIVREVEYSVLCDVCKKVIKSNSEKRVRTGYLIHNKMKHKRVPDKVPEIQANLSQKQVTFYAVNCDVCGKEIKGRYPSKILNSLRLHKRMIHSP